MVGGDWARDGVHQCKNLIDMDLSAGISPPPTPGALHQRIAVACCGRDCWDPWTAPRTAVDSADPDLAWPDRADASPRSQTAKH
jgi:hypothetical protein